MQLASALEIGRGDVVAFAGAGGKSSAIVQLAGELSDSGLTVLAAPTTKMLASQAGKVGPLVVSRSDDELCESVREALSGGATVAVGREFLSKQRVGGLSPESIAKLSGLADVTLVEADGARRRPLKGTADYEPELPEGATLVVAVGGIRALRAPLDEQTVHRPELFSDLTGIEAGQTITPEAFARALAEGSLHNTPPGVRKAALISGARPGAQMFDASIVARKLRQLGVETVVAASLPEDGPAVAWVL